MVPCDLLVFLTYISSRPIGNAEYKPEYSERWFLWPLVLSLAPIQKLKLTSRQKAQLRRPRPFLFLAILATFGLPWLLLFKTGAQARTQATQVDAAADIFLSQISQQSQNGAAKQFDRLAAKLGFIPNSADALLQVDTDAEQDYRAIEALLDAFLASQLTKTTGVLATPPDELSHYLTQYEIPLAALQAHLLEKPAPLWEIDFERMSEIGYSPPGFINVLNTQKLLLLSAASHAQAADTDRMLQAMEASWRLNEAISQQPDLVSQMLVSFTAEQQSGLLRHMEGIPVVWQERWRKRLSDRNRISGFIDDSIDKDTFETSSRQSLERSITSGLQFDVWLQYKMLQRSLLSPTVRRSAYGRSDSRLSATVSYWFSPVYYFSLNNIDTQATSQRAIEILRTLNICKTTQAEAEQQISVEKTAVWNRNRLPAETFARRWKAAGERALTLELTQKILQAKQLAHQNGEWPAALPGLDSDVCPGEFWLYERTDDGAIALSFSAEIDSLARVPLHYRSPNLSSKPKGF